MIMIHSGSSCLDYRAAAASVEALMVTVESCYHITCDVTVAALAMRRQYRPDTVTTVTYYMSYCMLYTMLCSIPDHAI
jgi:hypothetical protein